jgi:hypothetical protein
MLAGAVNWNPKYSRHPNTAEFTAGRAGFKRIEGAIKTESVRYFEVPSQPRVLNPFPLGCAAGEGREMRPSLL